MYEESDEKSNGYRKNNDFKRLWKRSSNFRGIMHDIKRKKDKGFPESNIADLIEEWDGCIGWCEGSDADKEKLLLDLRKADGNTKNSKELDLYFYVAESTGMINISLNKREFNNVTANEVNELSITI